MDSTEDPTLAALRELYGNRYQIRRSGRLWIATDRKPDTTTAPTLIENTPERLAEAMRAPGPRYGRMAARLDR